MPGTEFDELMKSIEKPTGGGVLRPGEAEDWLKRHPVEGRGEYAEWIANVEQPNRPYMQYEAATERASKGPQETVPSFLAERAVPFASAGLNFMTKNIYKGAMDRFQAGEASESDIRGIAEYEARQKHEANKGLGASVLSGLAHIPAIIGEGAVAGGVLPGGGAFLGGAGRAAPVVAGEAAKLTARGAVLGAAKAVPAYVGRSAAQAMLMPAMYLPQSADRAIANGGDWHSLKNLGPAAAIGTAQVGLLGLLSKVPAGVATNMPGTMAGRALSGNTVQAWATRLFAGTGTGMAGQQAIDTASTLAGWDTGYGVLGQLIEGKEGALKHALVQTAVFATFSALHAHHDPMAGKTGAEQQAAMRRILDSTSGYMKVLRGRGLSGEAAGREFMRINQQFAEQVRSGNYENAKSFVEQQPAAAKEYAQTLVDTVPLEPAKPNTPPPQNATASTAPPQVAPEAVPETPRSTPVERADRLGMHAERVRKQGLDPETYGRDIGLPEADIAELKAKLAPPRGEPAQPAPEPAAKPMTPGDAIAALGGGVKEGAADLINRNAQRIVSGESPEAVMQGLKPGGATWTAVMERVAQVRAEPPPVAANPPPVTAEPTPPTAKTAPGAARPRWTRADQQAMAKKLGMNSEQFAKMVSNQTPESLAKLEADAIALRPGKKAPLPLPTFETLPPDVVAQLRSQGRTDAEIARIAEAAKPPVPRGTPEPANLQTTPPDAIKSPEPIAPENAPIAPPKTGSAVSVSQGRQSRTISGEPVYTHEFKGADGKVGEVRIIPRGTDLHIEWVGLKGAAPGEQAGEFGFALRQLLPELAKQYPDATHISGLRISGARTGKAKGEQRTRLRIPGRGKVESQLGQNVQVGKPAAPDAIDSLLAESPELAGLMRDAPKGVRTIRDKMKARMSATEPKAKGYQPPRTGEQATFTAEEQAAINRMNMSEEAASGEYETALRSAILDVDPQTISPREMIEASSKLNAREKQILTQRMATSEGGKRTQQEIGDELGISRERIRQIEKAALKKLGIPDATIETLVNKQEAAEAAAARGGNVSGEEGVTTDKAVGTEPWEHISNALSDPTPKNVDALFKMAEGLEKKAADGNPEALGTLQGIVEAAEHLKNHPGLLPPDQGVTDAIRDAQAIGRRYGLSPSAVGRRAAASTRSAEAAVGEAVADPRPAVEAEAAPEASRPVEPAATVAPARVGDKAGEWVVTNVIDPIKNPYLEVNVGRGTQRAIEPREGIVIAEHPTEGGKEFSPQEWAEEARNPAADVVADRGPTAPESANLPTPEFGRPLTGAERSLVPGGGQEGEGGVNPRARETALANAKTDAERVKNGLPPILAQARLANPQVWDAAMSRLAADPRAAESLVVELSQRPRATTVDENALLLQRKVALQNEHERTMLQFVDGFKNKAAPEVMAGIEAREASILQQIDALDKVTKETGTEWGRAGQFRRQLAREDFRLSSMLLKAERAKQSPLTGEEKAEITELQRKISALEQHLADMEEAGRKGTPAQQTARIGLKNAKQQFGQRFQERYVLANQTVPQKVIRGVGEVLNLSRSLITSMDFSAVLRQGGFFSFGRPLASLRALPEMFRAFASKNGADRAMDNLMQRPNWDAYKKSGLFIAEAEGKLSGQEEAYLGRWVKKVPGLAGSERAYTTFLNRVRADVFDSMTASLGKKGSVTTAESQVIANFVNVATGRGSLGKFDAAAVPMATIFFSPRYLASRFQLLAGQPLWGGNARTRAAIAGEYARAVAGLAIFYGVTKLALGDDAQITFDPRSTDFGKVKVGNTRIDPMTGLSQAFVLLTRLAKGEKKTADGKVVPIRGQNMPRNADTAVDLMGRFVRGKLAPIPGAAVSAVQGEMPTGEPTTTARVAGNLTVPMSARDVVEAMQDQGIPRGTAISILNLFGMGAQTYEPRPKTGRR